MPPGMRKIAGPGASDNEVTPVDIGALQEELSQQVDGEVRFDGGSVGAYSTDSSNYRQVPLGVAIPRNVDAGATAVEGCRSEERRVGREGGGGAARERPRWERGRWGAEWR